MIKKRSLYAIIILICISAQSCIFKMAKNAANKIPISKSGGQIPPDFGKTNDTLLVVKNTISGIGVGTTIKKTFEKNYKGVYKIIENKDIHLYSIFSYRYYFYLSHNASQYVNMSTGRQGSGTVSCVIRDRLGNKDYSTTGAAFFGVLMKNYVVKLNEELQ